MLPDPGHALRRHGQPALGRPAGALLRADAQGRADRDRGRGPVITQGRTSAGDGRFTTAADYPLPSTRSTRLWLREAAGSPAAGTAPARSRRTSRPVRRSEEAPLVNGLSYESAPLARADPAGRLAVLEAKVRVSSATMHLTPVLVDIAPDGTTARSRAASCTSTTATGWTHADPVTGRWLDASVRLLPQDYTVAAGHRIGLRVQSSTRSGRCRATPGRSTSPRVRWRASCAAPRSRSRPSAARHASAEPSPARGLPQVSVEFIDPLRAAAHAGDRLRAAAPSRCPS